MVSAYYTAESFLTDCPLDSLRPGRLDSKRGCRSSWLEHPCGPESSPIGGSWLEAAGHLDVKRPYLGLAFSQARSAVAPGQSGWIDVSSAGEKTVEGDAKPVEPEWMACYAFTSMLFR